MNDIQSPSKTTPDTKVLPTNSPTDLKQNDFPDGFEAISSFPIFINWLSNKPNPYPQQRKDLFPKLFNSVNTKNAFSHFKMAYNNRNSSTFFNITYLSLLLSQYNQKDPLFQSISNLLTSYISNSRRKFPIECLNLWIPLLLQNYSQNEDYILPVMEALEDKVTPDPFFDRLFVLIKRSISLDSHVFFSFGSTFIAKCKISQDRVEKGIQMCTEQMKDRYSRYYLSWQNLLTQFNGRLQKGNFYTPSHNELSDVDSDSVFLFDFSNKPDDPLKEFIETVQSLENTETDFKKACFYCADLIQYIDSPINIDLHNLFKYCMYYFHDKKNDPILKMLNKLHKMNPPLEILNTYNSLAEFEFPDPSYRFNCENCYNQFLFECYQKKVPQYQTFPLSLKGSKNYKANIELSNSLKLFKYWDRCYYVVNQIWKIINDEITVNIYPIFDNLNYVQRQYIKYGLTQISESSENVNPNVTLLINSLTNNFLREERSEKLKLPRPFLTTEEEDLKSNPEPYNVSKNMIRKELELKISMQKSSPQIPSIKFSLNKKNQFLDSPLDALPSQRQKSNITRVRPQKSTPKFGKISPLINFDLPRTPNSKASQMSRENAPKSAGKRNQVSKSGVKKNNSAVNFQHI